MSRYNELREELNVLITNPNPLNNDRIIEINKLLKNVDASITRFNVDCRSGNYPKAFAIGVIFISLLFGLDYVLL